MPDSHRLPRTTHWGLQNLLFGLAANPSAPPDVVRRLVAARTCRVRLARRRDLSPDAAAALAADDDAYVREELAGNPILPSAVQAELAGDPDPHVRSRLAEGREYFTTAGTQGRRVPDPLAREVYETLARDRDATVRRALARNRHLPDDVRAGMLDDADPHIAAVAAAQWPSAPVSRIGELLPPATEGGTLDELLRHLDGPLPATAARDLLAHVDATADTGKGPFLLERIAAVVDLDAALTDRFMGRAQLRAAVAANPTLAAEHVLELARDPDNAVRAAVVARCDLDPVLRESIPVEYLDEGYDVLGWVTEGDLSQEEQLALARSRHQAVRKSLAMNPRLSDETVAILAADESFAVRLFVCERQPNAPGPLLAEISEQWSSYSRADMIAHPNFPAEALAGLARSDETGDRVVVAARPGLPAGTLEALLNDSDAGVRGEAAANPGLAADRVVALLGADDRIVAAAAAANPALPVPTMLQILTRARL